jgi:hypothetical protein
MASRLAPLLILAWALSACASLAPADSLAGAAPAAKGTAQDAYEAGVLLQERGDAPAARREWDRCVAMSSPDSPSRLDCLVALEKTALPSELIEQ